MRKQLFFSITALGISSVVVQIVLMRELLSVFAGNELVFGIILANWLLLTGLGSYLGKHLRFKDSILVLVLSQVGIALLPFFQLFFIRASRTAVFEQGVLVGLPEIFLVSLAVLLPYCVIAGYLLTLACAVLAKRKDASSIGVVYFVDNIGDILGGALFSFVLVFLLTPYRIALFLLIINLAAAVWVAFSSRKKALASIVLIVLLGSIAFSSMSDLDSATIELQYPGQEIVAHEQTLYGNIVITRTEDQLNFFENGVPLFSTSNTVSNEETVHFAMAQHPAPRRVLLISGGVSGTIDEILKYGVERVDYVELDPAVLRIGRAFAALDDERVSTITGDGRLQLKRAKTLYDVVLVDLPDPSSAQLNRFYTLEFFREVRSRMSEGGIMSTGLSSSVNYMSPETQKLNGVVYATLRAVFDRVIVIPGDRNIFVASDQSLSYEVAALLREKGIENSYVNEYYLGGILSDERIEYVEQALRDVTEINRDLRPVAYRHYLGYWIRHFPVSFNWLLVGLLVVVGLYLWGMRPVQFAVFSTGFSAASLEVLLLLGFQVLYGYAYYQLGIIITMFMLGLALGSHWANKRLKQLGRTHLVRVEYALIGTALAVGGMLWALSRVQNAALLLGASQTVFPLLTLALAVLVGMQFPLASKLSFSSVRETAAKLYSADLFGAALGALVASVLLVPMIGLVATCFVVGGLKLVSMLLVRGIKC
jgi:spermidine synthase